MPPGFSSTHSNPHCLTCACADACSTTPHPTPSGYDKYGKDKYGYDRYGYDTYGGWKREGRGQCTHMRAQNLACASANACSTTPSANLQATPRRVTTVMATTKTVSCFTYLLRDCTSKTDHPKPQAASLPDPLLRVCSGYDNYGMDKYGYDRTGYNKYGELGRCLLLGGSRCSQLSHSQLT